MLSFAFVFARLRRANGPRDLRSRATHENFGQSSARSLASLVRGTITGTFRNRTGRQALALPAVALALDPPRPAPPRRATTAPPPRSATANRIRACRVSNSVPDAHDHLRDDPAIGPLIEEYGERELDPADDPYERLVISIVNQLISTEAARTVKNRLFEAFEIAPETILAADEDDLRDVGLSSQKVGAMKNAAAWWREEDITREYFAELSDEEVIEELTEISGIGDWTGKVFLMFALGREDVFPVEDLAVRRGMEMLFEEPSRAEMREHAENWRPYRSVATLYVWQIYVDENSSVEEIVA